MTEELLDNRPPLDESIQRRQKLEMASETIQKQLKTIPKPKFALMLIASFVSFGSLAGLLLASYSLLSSLQAGTAFQGGGMQRWMGLLFFLLPLLLSLRYVYRQFGFRRARQNLLAANRKLKESLKERG